jgi:hypothetical protein
MAIGYVDPNPTPTHPIRTTNSRDVFNPPPPPSDPPIIPTDELEQLRALLTPDQKEK